MGKQIVAMILAGGKGTRLESLTRKIAKPAVSFGGKYRIIDFALSNCANSSIDTVGVLTQYESVLLNSYIGNGEKWGLNGVRSSTTILSPRQTEEGALWYKGTADAILQNYDFIESHNPDYVLILSGDHIYKMNYRLMLTEHIKRNADLSIAVLQVEKEEAKRFGIMVVDEENNVIKFQEKPRNPVSDLASMGIYIFNTKLLKSTLLADARDQQSTHDFGKDIIPKLLAKKKKLIAYKFDGYWRDVGTIDSLWQANMDLLLEQKAMDLYIRRDNQKIFSEDTHSLPQYIGNKAEVTNSLVNQGAIILGNVDHSIIFNEVLIEEDCVINNSVIMPNTTIKRGSIIDRAIVSSNIIVEENTTVKGDRAIALVNGSGDNST
jgi:glucose-1-phosphate adenylyltransferase